MPSTVLDTRRPGERVPLLADVKARWRRSAIGSKIAASGTAASKR
jgi:hypothetical protein